ncbi:peptidoglycan-recognition protein SB2-like [Macrosteles quadrilineatus]|uniref:peptidoglycan-recognition protein SB2-like n=1 Tax=Macrosteles quadrilineatus TaxID=74068 RepID=UPI0023E1225A|nr:peptidoglycan-recognition protein SB2-like [Macrosteles quadrilineatus]
MELVNENEGSQQKGDEESQQKEGEEYEAEQSLSTSQLGMLMVGGMDEQEVDMEEVAEEGARVPDDLVIVKRSEWGALPPVKVELKPHLTTTVMFTYSTRCKPCFDQEKCSKRARNIQKTHMSVGFQDIPYNFLVGGDGRVYEGRGWTVLPETHTKYVKLKGFLIEIAFIGDYVFKRPSEKMYDAALDLIQYGRVHFLVKDRFGLIENYQ